MTEKSKYRDWRVWQEALEVGVEVMGLDDLGLLEDQVKRTAVSISANIAEGATGDKPSYQKARKATARLETYLLLIDKLNDDEKPRFEATLSILESIQAQLGALMRKVSY